MKVFLVRIDDSSDESLPTFIYLSCLSDQAFRIDFFPVFIESV